LFHGLIALLLGGTVGRAFLHVGDDSYDRLPRTLVLGDVETPANLMTDRIEKEVRDAGGELSAARIGELCLEGLAKLDRGAYLQFAGTLREAPPELS